MNNFVELLDLRMKDGANLLKRVVELPQGAQGFYGIVYDKSQTTTLRIEAEKWQNIVKETLISYFGEHDRHVADFVRKIYNKDSFFDFKEDLSRELRDNISYLDTLKESIKEGLITFSSSIQEDENRRHNNTKKVFIVHGHDESARKDAELLMKDLGVEPIVLFKRPNMGDTIIEKLERESIDVCFAIVLYTSCDLGKAKEESELHPRARQNVVFEHGMMSCHLQYMKEMKFLAL